MIFSLSNNMQPTKLQVVDTLPAGFWTATVCFSLKSISSCCCLVRVCVMEGQAGVRVIRGEWERQRALSHTLGANACRKWKHLRVCACVRAFVN